MEKVIYTLWKDTSEPAAKFNARVRDETAKQLANAATRGVQVNVCDEAVAPAAAIRQANTRPQMDAVIEVWMDSAIERFRKPLDEIVASGAPRVAAYLVTESVPIRNTKFPPKPGQRTEGFSQYVFIQRPPRLSYEQWLHNWHVLHTPVAIETQSNFEYRQNVVARGLTYGAPHYDALVEECFPAAAMTNPQAFYDAVGNEEKFQKNFKTMMESCARFIDFDKIDVLPTSQYVIKAP